MSFSAVGLLEAAAAMSEPRRRPVANCHVAPRWVLAVWHHSVDVVVDEARAAGIEQFCLITGRGKTSMVEHFDVAFELERTLEEIGRDGVTWVWPDANAENRVCSHL